MSDLSGTVVRAPVRPGTAADTFPAAFANECAGGWHAVASIEERDAIPMDRRVVGMACRVVGVGLFEWTASVWVELPTAGADGAPGPQGTQGPAGAQGPQGPAGADGKTILNGAGAPSAGVGVDGDFYIDTTALSIYGPKTSGAWGAGTSLGGGAASGSDEWRTALTTTILLAAQQSVARMGFADGWIDSLLDTTGLNLANSTGSFATGSATGTAAAIATPTMTSNTAPSGVVYTNDDYGSPYAPWRAFNRANVDYTDCWLAGAVAVFATSSSWRQLEYDFVTPVTITDYTIITRNYDSVNQPKQWVIQGSNDTNNAARRTNTSGSWTTLDTRNVSLGGSNATSNFTMGATGSYRYYRILVKETNAGSSYTAIGELQFKTAAAALVMEATAIAVAGMSEFLVVASVNSGKTFTVEINAGSGWETVTMTRTAQSASLDQLSGILTRAGGSSVKVRITASDTTGIVYGWGLFWRA